MATIIFFLIIGILLGLGVPIFLREWGLVRPARHKPRPNVRKTWARQIGLPVGAAVVLCLLAWAGLSLLFSPGEPETPEVSNTITKTVPGADAGPSPGTTPSGAGGHQPAQAGPERELLVADTPLAKSALGAIPVATPLDRVGLKLGRKYRSIPAAKPKPAPEAEPASETAPKPEPKPETAPSQISGVQFTVHLASFSEKANADRSLARLKSAGVPVFVSRVTRENKIWHRLMAGRFRTRAEAEAYGRELNTRGLLKGMGEYRIIPLVFGPDSG